MKWPQHEWLIDTIFWGAVALPLIFFFLWIVTNFRFQAPLVRRISAPSGSTRATPSAAGPFRIPLLEFCDLAVRAGWKFHGEHNLDAADLLEGLRQAAVDKRVRIWGRTLKNEFGALNRSEPLVEIPPDHWRNFHIEWVSVIGQKDNFETKSDNRHDHKTPSWRRGRFLDLHVEREPAVQWLKADAPAFKGWVEKRHG